MRVADVSPPIGLPGVGWSLACSRRGSAHRKAGRRCQDAHAVWAASHSGSAGVVIAVADGHGDPRHDLSHIGSALAVRVATEELAGVFAQLKLASPGPAPQGAWTLGGLWKSEGRGGFLKRVRAELPQRLVRRWREAVVEFERSSDPRREEAGGDPAALLARHGTTLLTALVTEEVLLLTRLGDGDILWVADDGEAELVFPSEEAATSETSSLCSENAAHRVEVSVRQRLRGGFLLLATDGFSNAFRSDAKMIEYARSLCDRARQHGPRAVAAALPDWLDTCSRNGSGDDITLAVARVDDPPLDGLSARKDQAERDLEELRRRQKAELDRLRLAQRDELARFSQREKSLAAERAELERRHREDSARLELEQERQATEVAQQGDDLEAQIVEMRQALEAVRKSLGLK